MKTKKKMSALVTLVMAMLAVLPGAAFAAPDPAVSDNITVECRFSEGQTPDIPQTISQFGQTYHLIGTSAAVLESTLPSTRTYTYRISGAVTPEQLAAIQGAGSIAFEPVYLDVENEITVPYTFSNLDNNDVEDLLEVAKAQGIAGSLIIGSASGVNHVNVYEVSDISYEVTAREAGTNLPEKYKANCTLRGLRVTQTLGYYLANATFTTSVQDGETNQYIIVAEYAPEALPPIDDENVTEENVIAAPAVPTAPLPTVGLSDNDVALVAGQGSNPFADAAAGLVPIGGIGAKGVWSFLSLVLSAAAVIIAIAFAIGAALRRSRNYHYERLGVYDKEAFELSKKRGNLLRWLTIIFGILTPVTWLALDDFSIGVVWVNNHTILVGIVFLVTVVLCGLTSARNTQADRYATEEPDNTQIAIA